MESEITDLVSLENIKPVDDAKIAQIYKNIEQDQWRSWIFEKILKNKEYDVFRELLALLVSWHDAAMGVFNQANNQFRVNYPISGGGPGSQTVYEVKVSGFGSFERFLKPDEVRFEMSSQAIEISQKEIEEIQNAGLFLSALSKTMFKGGNISFYLSKAEHPELSSDFFNMLYTTFYRYVLTKIPNYKYDYYITGMGSHHGARGLQPNGYFSQDCNPFFYLSKRVRDISDQTGETIK